MTGAVQQGAKALVTGWATDPDTTKPIKVQVLVDGEHARARSPPTGSGGTHPGHMFSASVAVPAGKHTVCTVAVNALYGSAEQHAELHDGAPCSSTRTASSSPWPARRRVDNIVATGWAIDPETTKPIDGPGVRRRRRPRPSTANIAGHRRDLRHGVSTDISVRPTTDGEHKVCVQAVNVGGGSQPLVPLGCKIVNAVHPTAPAAPTGVTAIAGYGGAQVTWTAAAERRRRPVDRLRRARAARRPDRSTVASASRSTTVTGLSSNTAYTFSVVATNVAGRVRACAVAGGHDPEGTAAADLAGADLDQPLHPQHQRRRSGDLAAMRREGAADAAANPSGHGYLIVLDIGGQDESRQRRDPQCGHPLRLLRATSSRTSRPTSTATPASSGPARP